MHRLDGIWTSDHQVLVAALQIGATKVISCEALILKAGACCAIKNQNRPGWTVDVIEKTRGSDRSFCLCHHHEDLLNSMILRKSLSFLQLSVIRVTQCS